MYLQLTIQFVTFKHFHAWAVYCEETADFISRDRMTDVFESILEYMIEVKK